MSDTKALLRHSRNYLFAQIATKALTFISIPFYTRLLSVKDFGIVQVFLATVGIASVILTLNTEVAIGRYYYERKDDNDFKDFVGTSIVLVSGIFILMSLALILFLPMLSNYLSFSKLLTLSLIPISLYWITNSVFTQIYSVLLQSKKIALVTSVQTYLAFFLSVVAIILIPRDKYYGQVLGTIVAMILLWQYIVRQIKPYCNFHIRKKHIKYILSYSLPYLPYTLSGIIIVQFGRIITSRYGGFELAGTYSFSASIAQIMLVVISVCHSAWNPYYFQYMTNKDYLSIDKDYSLIWESTLAISLGLCAFGNEIGFILGKKEYYSTLYLIPYFVLGYVFYQWAFVYMRNTGYAKKVIWNAFSVISSGIINSVLGIILMKKYGTIGVAVSFIVSYFIMLVTSWAINKWILKAYAPHINQFLKPFFSWLLFWFACIMMNASFHQTNLYVELFKVLLCLVGFFIIMRNSIKRVTLYIRNNLL